MPAQFHQTERLALFIEGPALYAAARSIGLDIDYRRLLGFFRQRSYLVRTLYYTPVSENEEFVTVRPLIDWLEYNGFYVVTKPVKVYVDVAGRRKTKGSLHVDMAVHALQLAENLDHLILASSAGGFSSLSAALQAKGKRVSVLSTLKSGPAFVEDDLRRRADQFIELADIRTDIERISSRNSQGTQASSRSRVAPRRGDP